MGSFVYYFSYKSRQTYVKIKKTVWDKRFFVTSNNWNLLNS